MQAGYHDPCTAAVYEPAEIHRNETPIVDRLFQEDETFTRSLDGGIGECIDFVPAQWHFLLFSKSDSSIG